MLRKDELTRKDESAFVFGERLSFELLSHRLTGDVFPANKKIAIEKDIYPAIREACYKHGWLYHRIETIDQRGQPDILVTKGPDYWFIEAKVLYKKHLLDLQNDLRWQFGQLGFLTRCLQTQSHYMLAVIADRTSKGASVLWLLQEELFNSGNFTADFVKSL